MQQIRGSTAISFSNIRYLLSISSVPQTSLSRRLFCAAYRSSQISIVYIESLSIIDFIGDFRYAQSERVVVECWKVKKKNEFSLLTRRRMPAATQWNSVHVITGQRTKQSKLNLLRENTISLGRNMNHFLVQLDWWKEDETGWHIHENVMVNHFLIVAHTTVAIPFASGCVQKYFASHIARLKMLAGNPWNPFKQRRNQFPIQDCLGQTEIKCMRSGLFRLMASNSMCAHKSQSHISA